MFILHSLGTLLGPGNSWKISLNYAKYLNEDFSLIGQLNWGKYVVDTLLLGLDEFQSKLSYPSGDFNFLVMHCLDMVDLEGLEAATAPTYGYWDDGRVTSQPFLTRYYPFWAQPSRICFWVLGRTHDLLLSRSTPHHYTTKLVMSVKVELFHIGHGSPTFFSI
ncbi:hypothetical protein LINPERHAP1_LOCUS39613 [Linum perenne]